MTDSKDKLEGLIARLEGEGGHTPGPWTWDNPQNCASGLSGAGGSPVIEDMGYDGLWIDPSSANARLIAAAPDLLEALTALLDYDEQDAGCVPTHAHLDAQDDARAAILKARASNGAGE